MTSNTQRLWLVLLLIVVFIGGLGSGVLLEVWLERPVVRAGFFRPPGGFPGRFQGPRPGALLRRLSAMLDLTDAQRDQLETLFDAQRTRLRRFYSEVRERFEAEQRDIRAEVAKILTPAQQERFEELTRRRRFRGGPHRNGPGRPPDGRF